MMWCKHFFREWVLHIFPLPDIVQRILWVCRCLLLSWIPCARHPTGWDWTERGFRQGNCTTLGWSMHPVRSIAWQPTCGPRDWCNGMQPWMLLRKLSKMCQSKLDHRMVCKFQLERLRVVISCSQDSAACEKYESESEAIQRKACRN